AGIYADAGNFEYFTTTLGIEAERTITYPSGGRDVYTDDYYLHVYGWNFSALLGTEGVNVPLSGRFLITLGNPTGQRTQTWGGEWLNVQSMFGTYDPPIVEPPKESGPAKIINIPDAASWSANGDATVFVSPQFNYDASSGSWSLASLPAPGTYPPSDLHWLQGSGKSDYLAAVSQSLAWGSILSRDLGAPSIVQDIYGSASSAAAIFDIETSFIKKEFEILDRVPDVIRSGTGFNQLNSELDELPKTLLSDLVNGVKDFIVDKVVENTFLEYIVNFWRSVKLVKHESTESFTMQLGSSPFVGGTHKDTMIGSMLNDSFSGGSNDDIALGGQGNDTLQGGAGNDTLDGGTGTDTAVFSGNLSAYTITKVGAGYTVTDSVGGRDGTDTLTNIERLQFSGAKIALDIVGNPNACFDLAGLANAGQVYRLYQAAFNRAPDKVGLNYWIGQGDTSVPLTTIAAGFTGSVEFRNTYGSLTNHQFVDQLYQNVLHRAGESGGLAYWYGQIDNGSMTREQALVGFSESTENQAAVIGTIQNGIDYTT
ncbi:MAG: DUF4214 domain-containing protein, partial [Rhodocyclaceae bacterium]|nr:DUF4214 domain-containing protein [Rhodocyclaceae bacterium]